MAAVNHGGGPVDSTDAGDVMPRREPEARSARAGLAHLAGARSGQVPDPRTAITGGATDAPGWPRTTRRRARHPEPWRWGGDQRGQRAVEHLLAHGKQHGRPPYPSRPPAD